MNGINMDMNAPDNIIQTFLLEESHLRGRVVRLGGALDESLANHHYPDPLARLTAEAAVLAVLLSSMLKYEGIFTLQTQGDGPVSMVVADMTSDGHLRACATIREGREGEMLEDALPGALTGPGYLAFTVDQGAHTERYQGIVELKESGLADSVQHYFRQSEQINTGLRMAVAKIGGVWRGGGVLIQRVPDEGGHEVAPASTDEDDWRRTMILLETCKDEELLDPSLSADGLLYRLFHEEGVRVFEPKPVIHQCRCGQEKLAGILRTMPPEDVADMVQDGTIGMTCQFCSKIYHFNPDDLRA